MTESLGLILLNLLWLGMYASLMLQLRRAQKNCDEAITVAKGFEKTTNDLLKICNKWEQFYAKNTTTKAKQ